MDDFDVLCGKDLIEGGGEFCFPIMEEVAKGCCLKRYWSRLVRHELSKNQP
jgi:hypothetical protein